MRTSATKSTSNKEAYRPLESPTDRAKVRIAHDLVECEASEETLPHSSGVPLAMVTSGLVRCEDHPDNSPREKVSLPICVPKHPIGQSAMSTSTEIFGRKNTKDSRKQTRHIREMSHDISAPTDNVLRKRVRSSMLGNKFYKSWLVYARKCAADMPGTHPREYNYASTPHFAMNNEEANHSSLASAEVESISAEMPGTRSADRSERISSLPEPVLKAFESQCMPLQGGEFSVNDSLGERFESIQHLSQVIQRSSYVRFPRCNKSAPEVSSRTKKRRAARLTWDAIT